MASAELMRLYKLHEIDLALHRIRKQAGDLEEGKRLQAAAQLAKATFEASNKEFHDRHAEQLDLELANEQITEKVRSIEKQLFGGSITNAKEIEAFEAQKKGLLVTQSANDDKLLPLYDLVPGLEAQMKTHKQALEARVAAFQTWKTAAEANRSALEAKFKQISATRAPVAKTISGSLLARYDAIRAKHTIGMAVVTSRSCQECGSPVPELVITQLLDDKVVPCEGCQRILYHTGGVV